MISIHIKSLVMALSGLVAFAAAHSATLDDVKARGALRCGVNQQLAGFSRANSLGEYSGFDIDVCRAVATAVFNDPEAVDMLPVTAGERFIALKSGALDILSRNTTWTLQRNSDYGAFVGVNFYDGQGFMVSEAHSN
ncbi:MAG: general L-amino acid transport system substrate-binding protein [Halioglobus sp.]|jgi:general L-amino acid transport system substrate-binding protein